MAQVEPARPEAAQMGTPLYSKTVQNTRSLFFMHLNFIQTIQNKWMKGRLYTALRVLMVVVRTDRPPHRARAKRAAQLQLRLAVAIVWDRCRIVAMTVASVFVVRGWEGLSAIDASPDIGDCLG
ncbi:jg2377 [Pararge aegeria aegeria]|uniref:Jg2377 protein n=1 Tax=Pararge aegeria aegeria TaxID=348720 RepID=A0A8S4QHZ7_9NEOP|nr:jg2377 [Pararge aegeria aegeria]